MFKILNKINKCLVICLILASFCTCHPVLPTELPDEYVQLQCLTELLFYEGRGTKYEGMLAIAHVVKNRAKEKSESFCTISKEKSQFSFHKDKHKQVVRIDSKADTGAFNLAEYVALGVQEERLLSPFKASGKVLWYHTNSIARPSWTSKMKVQYKDRWHTFYSIERKSK